MKPGYTLIEVLVALAVFAILAAMTSSVMYYAFDTRLRVNQQADRFNTLELVITILEHDIEQIVERGIRGNEMHLFAAFIGHPQYVEFTRGGIANPNGMELRSTLKRMAYLCRNKQLIRRSWEILDTPNRKNYQDKVLLDNLDQCSFAYLTKKHDVLPQWDAYNLQQNQIHDTIPAAIQVTLTLQNAGNMSLLFAIPEGIYAN